MFCRSCSTCRCISDVFVGRKAISTSPLPSWGSLCGILYKGLEHPWLLVSVRSWNQSFLGIMRGALITSNRIAGFPFILGHYREVRECKEPGQYDQWLYMTRSIDPVAFTSPRLHIGSQNGSCSSLRMEWRFSSIWTAHTKKNYIGVRSHLTESLQ